MKKKEKEETERKRKNTKQADKKGQNIHTYMKSFNVFF